ncbi:MAG: hypothetical protein ACAI44_20150 [Candidatus Sericytochromatia bacterium]
MPTVQATKPLPAPSACPAPAARTSPAPRPVKAESKDPGDLPAFKTIKQGSATASLAGTLVTLPNEALKANQTVAHAAQLLQARSAAQAGAGLGARVLAKAAIASGKIAKGSQYLSKAGNFLMHAPVLGKLTQPHVAEVVTHKVMPVVNAVGASIGIIENGARYQKAAAQGNTAGKVVSGVQIGLNAVSGVSGFIPGRGQAVSAVTGLASLALEGVYQLTGNR